MSPHFTHRLCLLTSVLQFLEKLSALFEEKKDQGTIWLTHKRRTQEPHKSNPEISVLNLSVFLQ